MALKDTWVDRRNGEDINSADDINQVANAVIEIEKTLENNGESGDDGENGATFTPSVSTDGTLSWTNDKGLKNPPSVNIKGADGETPVKGTDYFTDADKEDFLGGIDAVRYVAQNLTEAQKAQARANIGAIDETKLAEELAKRGQLAPEYANSIEECTDTTKMYVLPDGFIYAYTLSEIVAPSYTNVLPTAQTSATDATPFNGTGYQEDACLKNTAAIEDASSFAPQQTGGTNIVTGYIPITGNEKIYFDKAYIYKFSSTRFYCWFTDASGGNLCYISPQTLYNGVWTSAATMGTSNNVVCLDLSILQTISGSNLADLSRVANAKFVRFSLQTDGSDPSEAVISINEEIKEGTVVQTYAWTNTGLAFVPADYEDRIVDLEADVAKHEEEINTLKGQVESGAVEFQSETPEVVIPSKLYGVVGHEFVLYYYNILKCMIPEDFVVTTVFKSASDGILSLAPQFERMLKFTPTAEHIGTHNITIKVINRRTWETVATKDSSIIIVADTEQTNKKVMFIGDSLTEDSTYVAEIERMTNNGVTSIGTISKAISFDNDEGWVRVESEGRSGWASYDYMKDSTRNGFTNPFYNPDVEHSLTLDKKYNLPEFELTIDDSGDLSVLKHHFDFAYYIANNPDVGVPDAVFINLGTNGGNGYSLPYVYIAFDAMIERIRAYSATMPIFLHLFPPVSSRGDGQRTNNGVRNVNIAYDARTGYYDCIKTLIERYENNPNVIIVPTYLMLDTLYDFKMETVPVSARNSIEVTISRSDNGHPAAAGYYHMADSYYNVLQYVWGE